MVYTIFKVWIRILIVNYFLFVRAAAFMQDENFRCAYNDALKCVDFDKNNEKVNGFN